MDAFSEFVGRYREIGSTVFALPEPSDGEHAVVVTVAGRTLSSSIDV